MIQQTDTDPSDSKVQREIELAILDRLSNHHDDWQRVDWKTLAIELRLAPVWRKTEPDAVWKTNSHEIIIAECYARVGALAAGHRRKLAMDTLKLLSLRKALEGNNVRCLMVVPEELGRELAGDGWFPTALRLNTEIIPIGLLEHEKKRLAAASKLQAEGQARTRRDGKDRTE